MLARADGEGSWLLSGENGDYDAVEGTKRVVETCRGDGWAGPSGASRPQVAPRHAQPVIVQWSAIGKLAVTMSR